MLNNGYIVRENEALIYLSEDFEIDGFNVEKYKEFIKTEIEQMGIHVLVILPNLQTKIIANKEIEEKINVFLDEIDLSDNIFYDNDCFNTKERRISFLCRESLAKKWHDQLRIDGVSAPCPFCRESENTCSQCLCPKEICQYGAQSGYIANMIARIHEVIKSFKLDKSRKVIDVVPNEFHHMIKLFQKYIIVEKK